MRQREKDTEEFYIQLFRKVSGEFPAGRLVRSESPDFIIESESGQIGVEVTRLYKSRDTLRGHLQVQEQERALLVKEAVRLYEQGKFPPVEAWIHFAIQTNFNKSNRTLYATKLKDFISSAVPPERSWHSFDNDFRNSGILPHEFDSISVARYGHKRNFWHIPGGGMIQTDFTKELQDAINKKDRLLPKYNQSCSSHFLLIVIDNMDESTLFEPSETTLAEFYSTKFDGVFLLDRFLAKAYKLNTNGAA